MIHDDFVNHAVVVWIVAVLLTLHAICWGLVYFLAFRYGLISYPYLFLSAAFGWDPARSVAAFFLPVVSVLTGVLMWIRSIMLKPRLKTVGQKRLLRGFDICTWLVCLGLLGVSAISIHTNIYVHLLFAFVLFISGISIMIISTVLDSVLHIPVPVVIKMLRIALTLVAVVSGILLGVFFVPYPFFGSLMEMISTGAMTAYFCTFASRLEKVQAPSVNELECAEDHRLSSIDEPRSMSRRRIV